MLSSTPQAQIKNPGASVETKPVLSRPLPPGDLPDIEAALTEGKNLQRMELKRPDPKPATNCGHRDVVCKRDKAKKEKKVGQNFIPDSHHAAQAEQMIAESSPSRSRNWLHKFGQTISSALFSDQNRGIASPAPGGNSFVPSGSFSPAPVAKAATAAVALAPAPPNFTSLEQAKLDPRNRVGGAGEDLFSGNYHWSLPLVNLSGRAGMDLNLTLSYNSLVWIKHNGMMSFDYDYYPTLTPGFRLGFPEIEGPYTVNGYNTYLVTLPSGRRVEMRYIATNKYEAVDSSWLYLTINPGSQNMILSTTDGTQFKFTIPPGDWWYHCTEIKDSNGNYITVSYTTIGTVADPLVAIGTITDTLGRVINFNYSGYHLLSITQVWNGQTHTWAQFDYNDNQPVNVNFGGLVVDGPTGGATIPVITRVMTGDGARHTFVYNTWGQVNDIWRYGEADNQPGNQRAAMSYAFPNTSAPLSDCPRFSQRNDYALNWAGANYTGWVSSYFYFDLNETFGQVTTPDGVTSKQWFGTSGNTRGLPTGTETWYNSQKKKWTTATWAADVSTYPLRPRVTETNIYDDANGDGIADNHSRTTIDYLTINSTIKLPNVVWEYNADGTTVLRRTETSYVNSASYTNLRILGLPSLRCLYDGSSNLMAETEYLYDTAAELQATPAAARQHDGAGYGTSFLSRGNLTKVRRYNTPTTPDDGIADNTYTEAVTGYNITGSVVFTKDALNHQTTISYTDSFANNVSLTPATFAYPTTVTDPDNNSSTIKYNYDFGAVTEATDPKGAKSVRTYETHGRLDRAATWKDGAEYAYTRYGVRFKPGRSFQ